MSNSVCGHSPAPVNMPPRANEATRIAEGLDLLAEDMRPLGNVVQAFRRLLVERARFKADLQDFDAMPMWMPDSSRFESGVPLSTVEDLLNCIDDSLWVEGAKRLMPIITHSFPKISVDCRIIRDGLFHGILDPRVVLKASLMGSDVQGAATEPWYGASPQALSFTLGQIAKPLIEKISCNLGPLVNGLSWIKGYCPICGTMPELAFLQGEGGQRWLRCASCSHEWRFTLLTCPFCESENQEDFEIYYVAGREYETVDVCHKCKRYVLTIDLRKLTKPIAREIAAMALMHLDVIAQEKGFLPAALCAWNIVRERDVCSTPVHL